MPSKIEHSFQQMEAAKSQMLTLVEHWSPEEHAWRFDENTWSILQVLDHVYMAEANSLSYMKKKSQGRLKPAGITAKLRYFSIWSFFNSGFKFKVPVTFLQPEDSIDFEQQKIRWNKLRLDWIDFTGKLKAEQQKGEIFRHPLAGRMNLQHCQRFCTQHIKHHIKQLRRINAQLEKKS